MYDLLIIGAGPGGYLLAERVGKKLKTAIVEKEWFGGTCLNVGCIPSKSLLYSRKMFDYANHGKKYGLTISHVEFNQQAVIRRKDQVVKMLVSGVEAKVKANKVTIYRGQAQIIKQLDNVFRVQVNDQILLTKKLVIATGSTSSIPPIKGLKERLHQNDKILTNIEILALETLPENLLIIGGGIIGLEMAAYFCELVRELNVVEFQSHIAGQTDWEISAELLKYYQTKGIKFHLSTIVTEIKDDEVVIKDLITGQESTIPYQKILIATGRKPFSANLGLEAINLYTENGAIVTDNKCQTNVANVYAIGDVNGKSMLAHTAYREAEVVANQLLGHNYDVVDYQSIPSVIYTNPEVASVGYTEEELKTAKIHYSVRKMPMTYSGRFIAEVLDYETNRLDYQGLVKMLVHQQTKQILGLHAIGQYATEIISIAGVMVTKKMTTELAKDIVMPHPTISELIHELIMEEK